MAQEIRHFTATIAANTPVTAPETVPLTMPVRRVTRIDWRVPKGPMGVFGWYVAMGGVQVQPVPPSGPVIANGEKGTWELNDAPDGGTWQVIGYNTGANPHSVYLVFYCDPVPVKKPAIPVVAAAAMMPAPDLAKAGHPLLGAR